MQNCSECKLSEVITPSILRVMLADTVGYSNTLYFCAEHAPTELRDWIGGHVWKRMTNKQDTMNHEPSVRDSKSDLTNPDLPGNPD